jgi:hypothetical protein
MAYRNRQALPEFAGVARMATVREINNHARLFVHRQAQGTCVQYLSVNPPVMSRHVKSHRIPTRCNKGNDHLPGLASRSRTIYLEEL